MKRAKVDILDLDSAALTWPNKITEANFSIWIEERLEVYELVGPSLRSAA